ncbi:NlpC/P60 family protein [Fodinibius sediminis]|nr:NlpC/P60 family protein [Fodinibius sediminis]
MKLIGSIWAAVVVTLVAACSPQQDPGIEQAISHTGDHFAPDRRVALFDIWAEQANGAWILKGETNNAKAKAALMDSLAAMGIPVTDSVRVLPAAELAGKTFAIVNNSVANIRSRPSHPSQLATQALLGMPLQILKKEGGWYLVKTPDDYISWVDGGGIAPMNQSEYEEWASAPKLIYLQTYGFSYQAPDVSSGKVTDLVAGSVLKMEGKAGSFYEVSYPDGRRGYVARQEANVFDQWQQELKTSQTSLLETSKTMMGAPYLWGGTSTKGMDCSGFTKTVYYMNGMIIPRDASQQVRAGTRVDDQKKFDQLQVGDLLFFGEPATNSRPQKVVHVGMWIGDSQFIHSSGRVHISSVDSTADNFDAYNLGRYLESRRYLGDRQGNIMPVGAMYALDGRN